MNKFHILPMLSLGLLMACNAAQTQTTDSIATPNDTNTVASAEAIPLFVQCLMEAYPEHIIGYADNLVYWSDSTTMKTMQVVQQLYEGIEIAGERCRPHPLRSLLQEDVW